MGAMPTLIYETLFRAIETKESKRGFSDWSSVFLGCLVLRYRYELFRRHVQCNGDFEIIVCLFNFINTPSFLNAACHH